MGSLTMQHRLPVEPHDIDVARGNPLGRQEVLHRLGMPLRQLALQILERARPRRALANGSRIDQPLAQPGAEILGIRGAAERPVSRYT